MGAQSMTRKESLRLIETAFAAMDGPQDGFSTCRDKLYRMNLESEKQHRKWCGARRYGITVPMAAKLFTAQHLAESLEKPDKWTIDDITSIRLECLYAQAYAKRHRHEFLDAFAAAGVSVPDLLALDYAELVA
jgi:hypothetical protein